MHRRTAPSVAILGLLAGCAPAPMLAVEPQVLSADWSRPAAPAAGPRPSLGALLGSPELERLIAAGRANNSDLAAARARLGQALALLRVARGAALPLVTGGAVDSASRSTRTRAFDFSGSALNLDAIVPLDFFGQHAARSRSASARAAASFEDVRAATLALSVEIARAYVQRATLARRLQLIETSVAQAADLDRIMRIRQREGAASMVEVGLQSIRYKQLRTERSRIDEALDQTRTALAYLLGEEAPRFDLAAGDASRFLTPALPLPSPRDVIAARPDVRAAEARIRAAGGDVDAARRAFYPDLSLSLGGVLQRGPAAPLALVGNIGANVFATIFGRNRLRGELELASAQQREAVAAYRSALLNALREVEDAASTIAHADEREQLLAEVEREARTTEALARQQYLSGAEDLQHLLDAQDLLVSVQDARALSRQERVEGLIRLYAASGPEPAGI